MERSRPEVTEDHAVDKDWARLGQRILHMANEAIRLQREEEQRVKRATCVPFLRLVRDEACEREDKMRGGTAA